MRSRSAPLWVIVGVLSSACADEGSGDPIHCKQDDPDTCSCGLTPDYGEQGASCASSVVSSPAICCGDERWPELGECQCTTRSCSVISADMCLCTFSSFAEGNELVDSCEPAGGGICCLDQDGDGCFCSVSASSCDGGSDQVDSCAVESLGCGRSEQELESCN